MPDGQIGRALRRFEDDRFLRGNGRFVDDIDVLGQLHAIVVRSPHGHAAIGGIDTSAARALPGVHGVFTAADLAADKVGPLPCIAQVATVGPLIVPPRFALAGARVRHVGDPGGVRRRRHARDCARRGGACRGRLPDAAGGGRRARRRCAATLHNCGTRRRATSLSASRRATGRRSTAAMAVAPHVVEIELRQQPARRRPDRTTRRNRVLRRGG